MSGLLVWHQITTSHYEALLRRYPEDGVRFTLTYHPTCYRRGPWRLLIEICGGPNHHKWGCFDDQDQPLRNFHSDANAKDEAERIAEVLITDRSKQEGKQHE